jgi:hypothetical protein
MQGRIMISREHAQSEIRTVFYICDGLVRPEFGRNMLKHVRQRSILVSSFTEYME